MELAWFVLAVAVFLTFGVPAALLTFRVLGKARPGVVPPPPAPGMPDEAYRAVRVPADLEVWASAWNAPWAQDGSLAFMQQRFVDLRRAGAETEQAWRAVREEAMAASPLTVQ